MTSGAVRIFLYNWPTFVLTWSGAFVVLAALALGALKLPTALAWLVGAGALGALLWSFTSLLVSYYVYDRSPLASGVWLRALLPIGRVDSWAAIDAGLDAEVDLDDVMPGTCVARLDIFDGVVVRAPSVQRARRLTPRAHHAVAANVRALPLVDASCDVVTAVFAAHEVRDTGAREALFAEVKRALKIGGRLLIVEHLRDVPNFLAYGPGCAHFQPRAEWLRLADVTGLRVAVEMRVTPWVMALALEKQA